MTVKELPLDKIRLDGETQAREKIDLGAVDRYADSLTDGAEFPAAVVFHDGSHYWLGDGFHRWHAHKKAGLLMMLCEIRQGSQEDAQWFACSNVPNGSHGLYLSNVDKRNHVLMALRNPRSSGLSDAAIAEHVGVTRQTVLKYRHELESPTCQKHTSGEKTGRDGRKLKTANIGKKSEARKTPPPPVEASPADEYDWLTEEATETAEVADIEPRTAEDFYSGDPIPEPWSCPDPKEAAKTFDIALRELTEWEKRVIENLIESDEPATAFFDPRSESDFKIRVQNLRELLKTSRPYSICAECMGERCKTCRNSGLVPRRFTESMGMRKVMSVR